jgi:hypothetical protein
MASIARIAGKDSVNGVWIFGGDREGAKSLLSVSIDLSAEKPLGVNHGFRLARKQPTNEAKL